MNSYSFYAERSLENYNKSDFTFVVSVILLTGLGLFTLYFCSQNYAERIFHDSFYFIRRQSISALVGLFGFILFASLKISVIRKILPVMVGVTLLLCILTFVPGISIEKNGARRWLRMPFSFTLQPSEFVKFTLVVFLANIFDKLETIENPEERSLFPSVFVMLVFI
ncbi:MAG: FtsW/RodA/SpoVE family cell cycle protein, partial [Treponema sp.]